MGTPPLNDRRCRRVMGGGGSGGGTTGLVDGDFNASVGSGGNGLGSGGSGRASCAAVSGLGVAVVAVAVEEKEAFSAFETTFGVAVTVVDTTDSAIVGPDGCSLSGGG